MPLFLVIAIGIDEFWFGDLFFMEQGVRYKRLNGGYTLFLLLADALSNFIWTHPLKNKSTFEVLNAFKNIIEKSKRKPIVLTVDAGKLELIYFRHF